jgi:hypothetical protein
MMDNELYKEVSEAIDEAIADAHQIIGIVDQNGTFYWKDSTGTIQQKPINEMRQSSKRYAACAVRLYHLESDK